MTQIRVRFPPSPTGYLHIGGVRTALFNWLYARKYGGKLVLRIEDTDVERSTDASTQAILDGMRWLGLDWDEGPYFQSEHAAEHRMIADKLVQQGAAYRCYCTKEELDARREAAVKAKADFIGYDGRCRDLSATEREEREAQGLSFVVRFRSPEDPTESVFDDLVFGSSEPRHIEDFVIVRSTGVPLYVLANVVDDHRDAITHVLRGQEHLMNTPKQVLLYKALGWPLPQFGHMALILDPKKAKISKRRHGEVVAVQFYRDHGFLPWAFANFTALLGWSPGNDREVFLDRDELIEAFSLDGLGRKNSVFNYRKNDPKFITDAKAIHINAQHIRMLPVDQLAPIVESELKASELWRDGWRRDGDDREWFLRVLELIRPRYHYITDFSSLGRAYFSDDYQIEDKAMRKGLRKDPATKEYLPMLAERFEALEAYSLDTTETALRGLAAELDVKPGLLINAARAAVSGQAVGPGLFDILVAVGQERTISRLRAVAGRL